MFTCSPPPTRDEFGLAGVDNLVLLPTFNPDVDFVKRRRPLVKGDDDPPPEGEEGDNEEDIKFDSPNPRVGRFADERDAFRPRVAKNPPVDEFDDRDVTAGCLMVVEMRERGVVMIKLEGVEEWVRGGSVLAERWVLALPPLIEGNVELEPEERRSTGEVINVVFEVDGEAAGAMFDAAAR